MDGYDKNIRPYYLIKPVEISIDIFMNSFGSVSASDMSYAVNINLRQRWNDPRLDFSHETVPDDVIPIHASLLNRLWMPDLIFTNEKSSRFHNVTTENKLVRLSRNGDVYTSMRISLVLSRIEFNISSLFHFSLEFVPEHFMSHYVDILCLNVMSYHVGNRNLRFYEVK